MNSTSKLLLAVIGAAAAGAIIGMLVAPEKVVIFAEEFQILQAIGLHNLASSWLQVRNNLTISRILLPMKQKILLKKVRTLTIPEEKEFNRFRLSHLCFTTN
jgi:hypothetical protein